MNPFRYDSKPMQIMASVADMMLLNLCWLLSSIPVVTIGIATTAVFSILGQNERKEGAGIVKRFFAVWKKEWRTATAFWLLQLVVTALLVFNILFFGSNAFGMLGELVKWFSIFAIVILCAWSVMIYPQIGRYRNTFLGYLKNGLLIMAGNFWRCVLVLILMALPVIIFMVFLEYFLKTGVIWIMFGFSFLFWLSNKLIMPAFEPLEDQAQKMESGRRLGD